MSSRDLANLKNGLVAAWIPSLGATGYRLVDRVGSNHGVLTNMDAASDWVVSNNNLALDFDGTSDYVNLGANHNFTGAFSFSIWANLRSKTGYRLIFTKSDFGSTPNKREFLFYVSGTDLTPTDSLAFVIMNPTSFANRIGRSLPNASIPLNQFTNFICTYTGNGANSGIAIYINGVRSDTTDQNLGTFTGVVTQTTPLAIGTDFNNFPTLGNQADMISDDIRIYNRALSATEVSLLSKERGIGFKTSSRTSSAFAKRYAYKPPKDKTYAAITRSQSDYDSLREGLVLAICPSVSGATGYRAVDVSGKNNHGTLQNMTPEDWVPSGGALSLDFDGSNDYVSIPEYGTSVPLTQDFGISCFIKTSRTIIQTIANNRPLAGGSTNGNVFWLSSNWSASGQIAFQIFGGTVANPTSYGFQFGSDWDGLQTTGVDCSDGKWHHVFASRVGSIGEIWIDGVLNATASNTLRLLDLGKPLFIGYNVRDLNTPYLGQIDDVRYYARAVRPAEIRRLASGRGVGLKPTSPKFNYLETREKTYSVIVKSQQEHSSLSEGLVGAWCPSLGATGYRLIDRSGYGNHGVLTGMDAGSDWVVSGGALSLDFDGGLGHVVLPKFANDYTQYSISAFFITRTQNAFDGVVTMSSGSPFVYIRFLNSSGDLDCNFAAGLSSINPVSNNKWHHVCFCGRENRSDLYFNGKLVSTVAASPVTVSRSLRIGMDFDGSLPRALDGQMDDIRFYNRSLTATEVSLLASRRGIGLQPRPKQYTYYQFPSGSKRRRILTGMT
jgi:hypothetical protein